MIPFNASLGSYDHKAVSEETAIDCGDESLVQQHFKEEVDVNTIVRRFGLTPELPAWRTGVYGDFTGISDYESAVQRIEATQNAFMALPATLRDRFKNDPAELVRYAQSHTEEEFDALMAPPPAAPESDPPA